MGNGLMSRMDDFVSFPEVLDLAPYMAPNRNDYKMANTPLGPRAAYMDWASPDQGHNLDPVNYKLYGTPFLLYISQI
jgi:ubiquitin carboxyl-terminal hydrolase 16/45